ncbi:MAG: type 4a pilus biogenesis protein PilO [Candidatus Omnitrophica bacterium]|nr:type 4a pilus biogenesis protein PilO [Candidatus Omnitrophota bacterium]
MTHKFSQREKILAFLTIAVGIIFIGYWNIYRPFKNEENSIQKKIASTEKRLSKNLRTIQSNELSKPEVEAILKRFKQDGSDEKIMSAITTEIETAASQTSMRIADMQPKPSRVVDFYRVFSVNLSIDGELKSITEFIHVLQTEPHLFNIEELRINRVNPRGSDLRCQIVLSRTLIPKTE